MSNNNNVTESEFFGASTLQELKEDNSKHLGDNSLENAYINSISAINDLV
jgi:hypothetical protein